jgi:hypothetical protein
MFLMFDENFVQTIKFFEYGRSTKSELMTKYILEALTQGQGRAHLVFNGIHWIPYHWIPIISGKNWIYIVYASCVFN